LKAIKAILFPRSKFENKEQDDKPIDFLSLSRKEFENDEFYAGTSFKLFTYSGEDDETHFVPIPFIREFFIAKLLTPSPLTPVVRTIEGQEECVYIFDKALAYLSFLARSILRELNKNSSS
jgi:hypothetical protein